MNVKKLILSCMFIVISLTISMPCFAQETDVESSQPDSTTYGDNVGMNLNYTTLIGVVKDEKQAPVANLRIEIEVAPDRELRSGLSLTNEALGAAVNALKATHGRGVFTSTVSNENGEYKFKGILVPGVYYLHIRNAANYFPTKMLVAVDPSVKKEFQVPVLNVTTRETPVKVISDKALKEMDKSRKLVAGNDLNGAIKSLQKVIEMEPDYAEAYYNLALLFMDIKKPEDAIRALEKTVQFEKEHEAALKTLGELYFFKKDYEKAFNAFSLYLPIREKLGTFTPEEVKIYFQTGNCLKALKRNDEATTYFEKYITVKQKVGQLDQKDSLICNDLGSAYYAKKEMKKVIGFYTQAIELDPAINPETFMYLGNAYLAIRDGVNAIKNYNKFLELDPKSQFAPQVKTMVDKLKTMYPDASK